MTHNSPVERSDRSDRKPAVVCSDCGVRKRIEFENEAVAFYRRHRSVTGHDIEWELIDAVEQVASDDLRSIIDELQARFPDGVPIGVITVAMSERGATIGETLGDIRELRMGGELYEPRDDHLRVT